MLANKHKPITIDNKPILDDDNETLTNNPYNIVSKAIVIDTKVVLCHRLYE